MASNSFEQPSAGSFPVVTEDMRATPAYQQWFTKVHNAVQSIYQSGPTSDRPTSLLWIGRSYYDTDLNQPVYVSAVKPTVWRDASGAIV